LLVDWQENHDTAAASSPASALPLTGRAADVSSAALGVRTILDRVKRERGVEQRGRQWWHNLALGLALALAPPPACAQYRLPADASDAAQPITIRCDAAVSWSEGNLQILLLSGNVGVEQGLVRARMKDAVVWLEVGDGSRDKPLPVVVYGEGEVVLQRNGAEARESAVLLELKTRGDFKLLAGQTRSRISSDDDFYRKAVVGRQALLQPSPIQKDPIPPPTPHLGAVSDKLRNPHGTVSEIVPRDLNPPPQGPGSGLPGSGRLRKVRVASSGSAPFQSGRGSSAAVSPSTSKTWTASATSKSAPIGRSSGRKAPTVRS
jgi:hypothetical protein